MKKKEYFFITDFNHQYFRLDANNQLVVAKNKDEASIFSKKDANKRISQGIKNKFYQLEPIGDWSNDIADINLDEDDKVQSHPNLKLKEKIERDEKKKIYYSLEELLTQEFFVEPEKSLDSNELSMMDWKGFLEHFAYITSQLSNYRTSIGERISEIDQKICDVLHYIELCEVEESTTTQLIQLLRRLRDQRRFYKDEDVKTEQFQRALGSNQNGFKAKEAYKAIQGLEKRIYAPRKLDLLFKGSQKRNKEQIINEIEDSYESVCEVEKKSMREIERRETPFDEYNMNWLDFARDQSVFYDHASQYMDNLELDLEEIENKIEDIMAEMAHARCNVTQGFRYFKELQVLQQEKNQKEREWRSLRALTSNFDMEAMAEQFRESLMEVESIYGIEETEEEYLENKII